ncbi:putative bifunctional diguanylate cyclase/phosphodiesterase [Leptodesmis sichuanensis]|uniref:putative bifunctional diguanylate cyclase/phosphodiesterase n=1 Tax=Leptodesmis sichuanensis TaxID=2906798 RepID=UPI001F32421D|nr:GGDEF domain-containing response regulator [Leptodesmis sichuanensis]UIE37293.1 EAL domain-containing protein [Leptodesmis sichuanensis A121]
MNHQVGIDSIDILIVDDTPENLRLLSIMLSKQGYQVRKAINGQMALTAVQALKPDLILLDIMMPELDGYEVCRRLKTNPETADIPVVFLSTLDDPFDKVQAFRVGGADYITKPFQLEEVLARAQHQLSLQVATRQLRQLNACLEQRIQERTQDLEIANAQLTKLALQDSLTGLANRIALLKRLEQALERAKEDGAYQFALLFLDCDRFKIVNDSLGHEVGDALLISIAHRLEQILKPGDVLARLGGDEFAIFLDQIEGIWTATQMAEYILHQIADPFCLPEQMVFINASIGIVLGDAQYEKPEHLLRDADTAMYHAKASGKAQYRIFDATMYRTALRRLQLEMELRQAIAERQFILHYQPIVDLRTGAIAGLEALVRWNHPTRLISPAEFIGVAEETGLINEIGTLVLREACHQLRTWQKQGLVEPHLSVSVNLSAYQFAQPELMEQILQILAETELEPHCLKLELTESAIMQNADSATQILRDLRQHQIQLSMDDFGTGYSSLSYLRSFPMDYLKIDRSFVQGLDKTVKELNLVAVIVAIAQTMEMKVIAEGIETPDQLAQLRSLNCDFGQGYLFSKPLPAHQIIDLLRIESEKSG